MPENRSGNYIYDTIYENQEKTGTRFDPSTFESFSGADLLLLANNRVIGEAQACTYSIKREVAPVFTFGTKNPLSFSSGKRGIAGSLVLTVFDREALVSELVGPFGDANARVNIFGNIANIGKNIPVLEDQGDEIGAVERGDDANRALFEDIPTFVEQLGGVDQHKAALNNALHTDKDGTADLDSLYTTTKGFGGGGILYPDEVPPFNITLSIMNEAGRAAQLDILGVEIMNTGQGFSVDDITNEKSYSFVALEVVPLRPRFLNKDKALSLQQGSGGPRAPEAPQTNIA